MGHVSGHSVPVPHLGREGAAAHGRLPAAHGRRSRARVGGDGMAAAAPRLPCAAAGGAAGRCSVARHGLFASRRLYGRLRCPAVAPRPYHAAENSEGFALWRLRRHLHGPAGPRASARCLRVRRGCACCRSERSPWRAAPALPLPCSACARWARASMPPCSAERACSSCSRSCACWRPALCRLCSAGRPGLRRLRPAAGYCLAVWRGFRQLDGMSGDISGFGLTLGELAGAAVLCLVR